MSPAPLPRGPRLPPPVPASPVPLPSARRVTEADAGGPDAGVRRLTALAFATLFMIGTDTFLVAPLLPVLAHDFGTGAGRAGWLVSAYALGYALLALFAGPFSDRRNRRTVLLWGMAAFTVTTGLCGAATGFTTMLLCRFLAGTAAAFVSPQIWATLPQVVPERHLVRTMGVATAGLSLSQVVGIPVGAWLSLLSWRVPFWTVSAGAACVWLLLHRSFPAVPPLRTRGDGGRGAYAEVLSARPLRLLLTGYLVFQTGNFAAIAFYGSWFARDFGLGEGKVAVAMVALGAGNTAGSLLGARVVRLLGAPGAMGVGFALAVSMYAAAPFAPGAAYAVADLTVVMAANGLLFPLFMRALQSRTTAARGTVASLANAAMYVGVTVGGIVGGALFTGPGGFTAVACCTVSVLLLSLVVYFCGGAFARH